MPAGSVVPDASRSKTARGGPAGGGVLELLSPGAPGTCAAEVSWKMSHFQPAFACGVAWKVNDCPAGMERLVPRQSAALRPTSGSRFRVHETAGRPRLASSCRPASSKLPKSASPARLSPWAPSSHNASRAAPGSTEWAGGYLCNFHRDLRTREGACAGGQQFPPTPRTRLHDRDFAAIPAAWAFDRRGSWDVFGLGGNCRPEDDEVASGAPLAQAARRAMWNALPLPPASVAPRTLSDSATVRNRPLRTRLPGASGAILLEDCLHRCLIRLVRPVQLDIEDSARLGGRDSCPDDRPAACTRSEPFRSGFTSGYARVGA